jgi:hypothetical protein
MGKVLNSQMMREEVYTHQSAVDAGGLMLTIITGCRAVCNAHHQMLD